MDPVVEECMIVGLGSNSIMRVINKFVIASKIEKNMVSQTTIRNKMSEILEKHSKDHHTQSHYIEVAQGAIFMEKKMG